MNAFTKVPPDMPIREDMLEAYRDFWAWLARPGTWWTGAERVAIAAEVRQARTCAFCAERKKALSPAMVQGEHDRASDLLSDIAVDAVHRIVTDATRLTQSWIEDNFSGDLTDGHYVELLGITVCVISVDQFNRALSLPPEPLPEPKPGEPSRYRPAGAEHTIGYLPMLMEDKASDEDADIYPGGRAANVMRALSLVPDCVRQWQKISHVQYLPAEKIIQPDAETERALDRAQIELVAARVSSINECFY